MRIVKTMMLIFPLLLGSTLSLLIHASDFAGLKGSPNLRSASALVINSEGEVIYGKDVDTVRPIASITKLMTAMVILDSGLDLNEKITVTKQDRDLVQLTGSRLEYGATLSRREMILLAIMSSENRAATALGRNFPGGKTAIVAEMNKKAANLGMTHSHFADPAGLNIENQSTARDLIKMVTAAQAYPLIKKASTTTRIEVRPYKKTWSAGIRQYQSPIEKQILGYRA